MCIYNEIRFMTAKLVCTRCSCKGTWCTCKCTPLPAVYHFFISMDDEIVGQLVSLGLGREMATLACGATGNQGLSAAVKWASQWFQVVLAQDAPQINAVPPRGVAVPSRQKSRAGRTVRDEAKLPANVIRAIARKLENEEHMTSILGFCSTIPTSSRQPASAAPGRGVVDMGVFREAVSSPRERQIAVTPLTLKGTFAGRIPPRAPTPRLSSSRLGTPLAHALHRQDVEQGETGRIGSTGPPARSGRKLRMGAKTTPRDIQDDKQKTLISNVFNSTLTRGRLLNVVPLTPRTVTACSAPKYFRPMSARERDRPISAQTGLGCHLTMQDRPKNCTAPPSLAVRSSEVEGDARDKRGATMVDDFQRRERPAAQREKLSSLKATTPRLHEAGPSHVPVQLTALKLEVASLRAELQAFVNTPAPECSSRQGDKNVAEMSMRFGKKKVGMCYDGLAIAQDIVDNLGVSFS
jgi:hypothetical protein